MPKTLWHHNALTATPWGAAATEHSSGTSNRFLPLQLSFQVSTPRLSSPPFHLTHGRALPLAKAKISLSLFCCAPTTSPHKLLRGVLHSHPTSFPHSHNCGPHSLLPLSPWTLPESSFSFPFFEVGGNRCRCCLRSSLREQLNKGLI